MRLTCLAATIHVTLNYTTVLQERRSKLNGRPVKNSKPSAETLVSLPITIWLKHKFIIGINFHCPDLKTFCVIKRWTNNPRSKYHRSHCCFHTVVTCTVLHPGTPRLHIQTESVPLRGIKGRAKCKWMRNPYSKKICCPVFNCKSAGDVFAGAAAHLRVCGRLVHLVLHMKKRPV